VFKFQLSFEGTPEWEDFPIGEDEIAKLVKKIISKERLHTKPQEMIEYIIKNREHINTVLSAQGLGIQERCKLVGDIAIGHGVVKKGCENVTRETSFASKFCSYFNWDFPKYDSLTRVFLNFPAIKEITGITVKEHDYQSFIEALVKLKQHLVEQGSLEEAKTLEELDTAIYRYMKFDDNQKNPTG